MSRLRAIPWSIVTLLAHLKKSASTGRLLKTSTGHLAKSCGGGETTTNCNTCGGCCVPDTITLSGISGLVAQTGSCQAQTDYYQALVDQINGGTFAFVLDESVYPAITRWIVVPFEDDFSPGGWSRFATCAGGKLQFTFNYNATDFPDCMGGTGNNSISGPIFVQSVDCSQVSMTGAGQSATHNSTVEMVTNATATATASFTPGLCVGCCRDVFEFLCLCSKADECENGEDGITACDGLDIGDGCELPA